jgi:hypothetical protein
MVVGQLTNREIISWAFFNTKFLIERAPSKSLYLNFGTLTGSWPLKTMEHQGSKLESMGVFNISMKFLIDRVPSCRKLKFWTYQRYYVENFSSLGAIAAEQETDGRTTKRFQ